MAFKILAFACFLAVAQAGLLAPVAHYAAPVAQVSHSHSSVSHHSAPAHYAPVAKVALAAPVAHYSAPVAHYSAPAHYAAPVAKLAYAAPVAKYVAAPSYHHEEEEYGPAEYSFEYSVHDEHTGDIKSQKETRHGDQVQGSYSLVEPDGSHRIVEYTADKHSGFNAVVHREEAKHPVAVQPVLKKVVAPLAVAAVPAYHSYQHAAPAYHSYQQAAPAYHSYQQAAPAYHSYQQAAPSYQSYQSAPSHSYYHH